MRRLKDIKELLTTIETIREIFDKKDKKTLDNQIYMIKETLIDFHDDMVRSRDLINKALNEYKKNLESQDIINQIDKIQIKLGYHGKIKN